VVLAESLSSAVLVVSGSQLSLSALVLLLDLVLLLAVDLQLALVFLLVCLQAYLIFLAVFGTGLFFSG
jgi:hypothetical protein